MKRNAFVFSISFLVLLVSGSRIIFFLLDSDFREKHRRPSEHNYASFTVFRF